MAQYLKDGIEESISNAALTVFARKGYHKALVDDIVRVSHTSKGAFYFHFPSKQALYDAVLERGLRPIVEMTVEAWQAGSLKPEIMKEAEKKYAVGTIVEGTVERAGGPGVFVQLEPGLTGLIPNSELGLPPGSDASKTHKPGDKVTIGRDRNVILDVSPPALGGLSIDGKLTFSNKDVESFADEDTRCFVDGLGIEPASGQPVERVPPPDQTRDQIEGQV